MAMDRQDVLYSKNVTDISFGLKDYRQWEGGKINFGVELSPFKLNLEPHFSGKEFRIYVEHTRIKGEVVLVTKTLEGIEKWFGSQVNNVVMYMDKRDQNKNNLVRVQFENVDCYEIHNPVKVNNCYEILIKFLIVGLKHPDSKVFNSGQSTKFWFKRLGVEIYED